MACCSTEESWYRVNTQQNTVIVVLVLIPEQNLSVRICKFPLSPLSKERSQQAWYLRFPGQRQILPWTHWGSQPGFFLVPMGALIGPV